ncbi:hypothetical protein Y032_0025g1242 [Ancylostoma ceylanicum]|uniref:Uncharacterized protein n=1 Tax=Ancylostoma ceylanicum TaxID=53326 RepID=A0A016UWS8_9BILA|nr:hypothetical protein Y032_0025g1242 [Ancylostoma ceylanicum]
MRLLRYPSRRTCCSHRRDVIASRKSINSPYGSLHVGPGCLPVPAAENSRATQQTTRPSMQSPQEGRARFPLVYGRLEKKLDIRIVL